MYLADVFLCSLELQRDCSFSDFGGLIGATAAYYGGKVDEVLMRCMDVLMAIPSTLLAITIISALGSSLFNMIIAMGVSQIARMSRIVRSAVMSVKDQEYIEACRACGTSDARIILRHILPNAMGPVLVQVTQTVARSVITVASLSFVGLGVSDRRQNGEECISLQRHR